MANGIFTYILLIYMVIVGKYTVYTWILGEYLYLYTITSGVIGRVYCGDISFTTKKGSLPVNPRHVGKFSVETGAD